MAADFCSWCFCSVYISTLWSTASLHHYGTEVQETAAADFCSRCFCSVYISTLWSTASLHHYGTYVQETAAADFAAGVSALSILVLSEVQPHCTVMERKCRKLWLQVLQLVFLLCFYYYSLKYSLTVPLWKGSAGNCGCRFLQLVFLLCLY